eukprot:scaffold6045_cov188-Prasinococcus_capsulatus_cf.AAC.2
MRSTYFRCCCSRPPSGPSFERRDEEAPAAPWLVAMRLLLEAAAGLLIEAVLPPVSSSHTQPYTIAISIRALAASRVKVSGKRLRLQKASRASRSSASIDKSSATNRLLDICSSGCGVADAHG